MAHARQTNSPAPATAALGASVAQARLRCALWGDAPSIAAPGGDLLFSAHDRPLTTVCIRRPCVQRVFPAETRFSSMAICDQSASGPTRRTPRVQSSPLKFLPSHGSISLRHPPRRKVRPTPLRTRKVGRQETSRPQKGKHGAGEKAVLHTGADSNSTEASALHCLLTSLP